MISNLDNFVETLSGQPVQPAHALHLADHLGRSYSRTALAGELVPCIGERVVFELMQPTGASDPINSRHRIGEGQCQRSLLAGINRNARPTSSEYALEQGRCHFLSRRGNILNRFDGLACQVANAHTDKDISMEYDHAA